MRTNMKKLLALLLCIAMTLTLLPAFAAAEGKEKEPDAEQPTAEKDALEAPDPKDSYYTESPLALGSNDYVIDEAGMTLYRPFTPTKTGTYLFYSTGSDDTYGYLCDASWTQLAYNDDGGSGNNFRIVYSMNAGQQYWIGVRYYSSSTTGTIAVFVDTVGDDPLSVGNNTYTVSTAGSTVYRPFTAPQSGTYYFYSTGSDDTRGYLLDLNFNEINDDDDGGDGNNFYLEREMYKGDTVVLGVNYYNSTATGSINVVIEASVSNFDGTIEWNAADVKFKGATPYVIYNGSAFTPRFTVKDAGGNVVSSSNYTYEYRENRNAGTAYVILRFTGVYTGSARAWFKIYLPATTETAVENVSDGIQISWAPVTGAAGYVIYRRAWNLQSAGWTTFERWNNTTDTVWTDETVYAGTRYQYGVKAYFAQRTDPVSGAVIGGNVGDNYNLGEVGPLKTTVRITTRELKSLKAGSKQITATWAGSKVFTGYQLKYATDADFTKNVTAVWVKDAATYSTVLKSLTNGTLYYVTVRSYHNFEGMTYFGEWSNTLCIKPGSGTTVLSTDTQYRAVLVGENSYASSPLKGCVNDMNALAGTFRGFGAPITVKALPNSSKAQILSAISSTFKDAKDNDISIFTYSGHGTNTGGTGSYQGALCAISSSGAVEYITFSELASALSSVKGRVIILLDSCHSGASIAKSGGVDPLDAFNQSAIDAFSGYWLETEDAPEGAKWGELKQSKFIVIAAASYDQSSWDGKYDGSGNYQGAFTAALVKGVGGTYPNGAYSGSMPADSNKDKKLTLKEVYTYTYNLAYSWTNGTGEPQRAQYYGTDSAVLFTRK